MINLIKFRRSGLWLLSFIAALLVLSPSAGAYQSPRIVGDNFGGWTYKDNSNAYVINQSSFTIGNWPGGYFKISAPFGDWTGEAIYSYTTNGGELSNNTEVDLVEVGSGQAMKLPDSATGKSVTFTLTMDGNKMPQKIKASWSDNGGGGDTTTWYLRGDFDWNTGSTFTKSGDSYTCTKKWTNTGWKFEVTDGSQNGWYGNGEIMSNGTPNSIDGALASAMMLDSGAKDKDITFTLTLNSDNKPGTLTATWTDNGGGGDTTTWYLRGSYNSWNADDIAVFTGSPLTVTIPNYKDDNGGDKGFKITNSKGEWYGNGATMTNGVAQTSNFSNNNHMHVEGAEEKDVTFTLTLGSDNKPASLTATWDSGNVGDNVITTEYYLEGGYDDWKTPTFFTGSDGKYVVSIQNWQNSNGFLIKKSNSEYYGNGQSLTKGTQSQLSSGGANTKLDNSAEGKTVTFTLTLTSGGKPDKLTASWDDNYYIPVYPIGINNRKQLETYNEPTYYLRGDVLNHNRVTPEYQFTKVKAEDVQRLQDLVDVKAGNGYETDKSLINTDKYVLEFTMRNTRARWSRGTEGWEDFPMTVIKYATPKTKGDEVVKNFTLCPLNYNAGTPGDISGTNGDFLEGEGAIAVFDPKDNTLKILKKKTGKLPFISLVGAEWKQNTVANDDKPYITPGGHSGKCTTDAGWQEAWIQYNDNNEIAKDLNGNVMYNTMWPPRNPIKFKTAFTLNGNEYDFTVSSDALVLNPVVNETTGEVIEQKGAQWKIDKRFEQYKNTALAYKSTGKSDEGDDGHDYAEQIDGGANDFFEQLALNDGNTYRLYKVEDIWLNGKFKFWTGWSGGPGNYKDGANWNNNANWGHYKKQRSEANAQELNPKSTVPLDKVDGDMTFSEPTYFKTLYFFYDVEGGKEARRSVFFTEIAKGGAQIAALSRENYTYGMYCPALKDTEGIEKSTVKSIKITSYKYNDDDNKTPIKVVYNNSDCNTPVENWNQIFSQLKGETTTNQKTGKPEKWVYDSNKYENGHYKYVMEVVIDDEEPIVVESNPFTIFVGEAYATLKTYQLVKREIPTDDTSDKGLGETDYKYITYSTNPKDKTYFVNLKVENDSDTGLDIGQILNAEYDLPTEIVDVKEMTEAQLEKVDYSDGTRFRFSPKLLFVGTVTGKNVLDARFHDDDVAFTEIGKVKGATPFRLEDSTGDGKNDTFYGVGEPVFYNDLEDGTSSGFNYSYRWSSTFDYDFEDAYGDTQTKSGVTDEVVVDNYLVFPEPKLIIKESRIEMFYGDSPRSDNDDVIFNQFSINVADNMEGYESELSAVTLGDPTNDKDGARYQQIRTAIVVERPNVTRRYLALAADFIQEEAAKDGLNVSYNFGDDNSAPLMEALFDFFLGEDQVNMSNGMVYTENGGNPEWFVYYTPTRKPSDIYYNVYANDSITGTNDWDLATNLGVVEGKVKFETKTMSHKLRKAFEELHIYERWQDGDIAGIRIQQNPPENEYGLTKPASPTQSSPLRASSQNLDGTAVVYVDNEEWRDTNVRVIGSGLAYNSNGDLIETVNVNIKFKSKTKNSLARVDKDGNPYDLNDDSYNGKDMHYDPDSNDDYFYVRVVNDKDEDLVEAKAISAKDLANGYTLTIEKNHGPWWDSEKGYDQLDFARDNSLIKTMTLKMSHLYPFIYGRQVNYISVGASVASEPSEPTEAPARVMYKAEDDSEVDTVTESDVVKSNPIEYTFMDGEVVTSVDELSIPAYGYVVSGVGYIEVHGEGVEIYGADGIKIATGEGRYEVGAGVYVVRFNGRVEKVIVR